jgi:hypothetical protein
VEADVAIHNALINLHGRCAGYAAARRALADMTAAGAVPDVVSKPNRVCRPTSRVEVRFGYGWGWRLGSNDSSWVGLYSRACMGSVAAPLHGWHHLSAV